jgi:hypothetical protein
MPRLKRRFASVVLPLVNIHGQVDIFVGRFNALARMNALVPFSDPDARTFPMRSVRPAKRYTERESKPPALDHPSSLRRATSVALNKVA